MDRFLLTPFFLADALPELEILVEDGWRVNKPAGDQGNLESWLSQVHAALAKLVAAAVDAGERPISIAGDCCATIGVLAGLQRAGLRPTLVWLDAHGDFNTPATSPSGFLGGMPLAMLVGRGDLALPAAVGLEPLAENRVVLTDARQLDPPERAALRASEVLHLDSPRRLLTDDLPAGPLYVHLDSDVVDPRDSPAHNYAAAGGCRADEIVPILAELAEERDIAAISMAAWNPGMDEDGRSGQVSMDMLQALLG